MPIAKLFVEGNLDLEILNPILSGSPLLHMGGTKNSLRPRALSDRKENGVMAGYLRDRDFDFDPPDDLTAPTVDAKVDAKDEKTPFGWRWCRHEIENYLLEPALVNAALGWSLADIGQGIIASAATIRAYEAARWTVGVARRSLPPAYELETRPEGLNEIALPAALGIEDVQRWAMETLRTHRERIEKTTNSPIVQQHFDSFVERFNEKFMADPANALLWFSGKDILAGMTGWLADRAIPNPGRFRSQLRDWVIENPDQTVGLFPEWQALITFLRT